MPSMLLFLLLYMTSFMMVLSSEDWFMIWVGLELNMMSFIMIVYEKYDQNSMESCMKYFFVQSLGSSILMMIFYMKNEMLSSFLLFILGYKIGAAPLHFWFPSVCSGLNWTSCFFLMFFQKIIPLMLMLMLISWISWLLIIMSMMFGAVGSFNQSNIKMLMAYSSIHHLGWIFLCNVFNDSVWMMYMVLYYYIVLGIILFFKKYEINYIYEVNKSKIKWWFVVSILSMAGMPPFLGFFLKWIVFTYAFNVSFIYMMVMIVTSVIMFYVYIRMMYDIFMCYGNKISTFDSNMPMLFSYKLELYNMIGLVGGVMLFIMMVM